MKNSKKRIEAKLKREERLKMFEGDFYQEKKVGDKWYVKMLVRGNQYKPDFWTVAEYSEKSFDNYKGYNEFKKENDFVKELCK